MWINEVRVAYAYNADNKLIEYLLQIGNGELWINDKKTTYEYDDNGYKTRHINQEYIMDNWEDKSQQFYEYDNGLFKRSISQLWDGEQWNNSFRYTTTYETTLKVNDEVVISGFQLYNNFPNPFNPTTKIEFSVPQKSMVILKVYDILGKEIATLINGETESGIHSVNFNAINLSSGIYFYTIEASSFERGVLYSETRKMLLLR
jgi:hypothetical protein